MEHGSITSVAYADVMKLVRTENNDEGNTKFFCTQSSFRESCLDLSQRKRSQPGHV